MARTKQPKPTRQPSSGVMEDLRQSNGGGKERRKSELEQVLPEIPTDSPGITQLLICVGGIYASFLTWAVLQEKVTTTYYGGERWQFSIVLNTVQSTFAAVSGYLYMLSTTSPRTRQPVFPSLRILGPLLLVSVTQSLASPFGYASLAHVDYVTYILAKSCKLVPVMLLHVGVFRKRYPLSKYFVVTLVTAGVALFSVYSSKKKGGKKAAENANQVWGLTLLGINLLFDGLTNSVQDNIKDTFRGYSGARMMIAQNVLSTLLTSGYLLLLPLLPVGVLNAFAIPQSSAAELTTALDFMRRNPAVVKDVLGFAACGAVGQIFIYLTLARFSSLLLVTVTVTRKMLTMLFSVVWFGHHLSQMQWLSVSLVFGGVGLEAYISKREKDKKDAHKAKTLGQGKKGQ